MPAWMECPARVAETIAVRLSGRPPTNAQGCGWPSAGMRAHCLSVRVTRTFLTGGLLARK